MEGETKDKDADIREVTGLNQESYSESILEASAPDIEAAHQFNDQVEQASGFDYSLVESFTKSVKGAIN